MDYELIIQSNGADKRYWRDLWAFRELFGILAWRDISVRYKQTVFGLAWAVFRPFLTMIAFTFVFGRVAGLPSEGSAPYTLMVFAAMLPWQLFSSAITSTSESLVTNTNLISKVYFPRLLVPTSTVMVAVLDFIITLLLLVVMMLWYQFMPSVKILAIIPLTLLTALTALGPGLIFCSLNVEFRDFRYILPFITQLGLYFSPVGFSSSIVPEKWRLFFELNPMVGVIDGFRWAILGGVDFPARAVLFSICLSGFLMLIGIRCFRSMEKNFADVI